MEKRFLIIGAGLSGATIARQLADNNYEVTLIEKRAHIAGNCFDYEDKKTNIRLHKYGPHIFHTSNKKVFQWLSRFTEWVDYEHKVLAEINSGKLVPFPPNLKTLEYVKPTDLVNTFYRPYSEKMWGLDLEEINPEIIKRVPIRDDYEDKYFPLDRFQKLPKKGYTSLIKNILSHNLIDIKLSTPFEQDMLNHYDHIFNSMPIDEFFNYKFGFLPYRSIKFHNQIYKSKNLTPYPVINYTNNSIYTRHTEWKNFPSHGLNKKLTIVTKEEPCDFRSNNYERYYPIVDKRGLNYKLYKKYKAHVPKNMTFIGRCGMYVYINMDQAVSSSLTICKNFINKKKEI